MNMYRIKRGGPRDLNCPNIRGWDVRYYRLGRRWLREQRKRK